MKDENHPDAEILRLESEYFRCDANVNALGNCVKAEPVIDAIYDHQTKIFHRLTVIPAASAVGLAAKLRVVGDLVVDEHAPDSLTKMVRSALGDAERLGSSPYAGEPISNTSLWKSILRTLADHGRFFINAG